MLAIQNSQKIFLSAFILMVLLNCTIAESRNHIPARVLAKQTGATQFEEERYDTHVDCTEHKHHLKKRASDEDVDYEVYQGVVGRSGIDFPIYPRIPKTSFSCRSYGNGYFADMETDCQVFHICEEGRKISFLCPNGTIFQQMELTCDWWFKVNCLGSSSFYADSSELLNKQKIQRLKPSVPVQGFNIVGGGLNIKPRAPVKTPIRSRVNSINTNEGKSDRRIDSAESPSLEIVDFDDLSVEKQKETLTRSEISNNDNNDNENENESQVVAESASFVSNRNHNNYNYDKDEPANTAKTSSLVKDDSSPRTALERTSQRHVYSNVNSDTTERARSGQRGQHRYRNDNKYFINDQREKINFVKNDRIISDSSNESFNSPTLSNNSGTYSTARKLESTRTTPFYTPTVPPISNSKITESRIYYVKGTPATTATPHRFSVNRNNGGKLLKTSENSKTTASPIEFEITAPTTFKPIIIGMRHNYNKDFSAELVENFKAEKNLERNSSKKYDDEFFSITTPATTGPTYLPKSKTPPTISLDAAGDLFLVAPITVPQEEISRNVNNMLKTIDMLKHKIDDVELIKVNGKSRLGLEIPPSSGPDALISLAQYFAGEQHNDSTSRNYSSLKVEVKSKPNNKNSLGNASSITLGGGTINGNDSGKNIRELPNKNNRHINTLVPRQKPSDTTATITTESSPALAINSDDIHFSLLSNKTVKQYKDLFHLNKTKDSRGDPSPRLAVNDAKMEKVDTPDISIKTLAQKPESRKIAQVFSNALTNYLNDPDKFRESLVAVRPTDPSVNKNSKSFSSTDSSLFNHGTGATYLPTAATANGIDFTTQSSIADVINTNLITSTFGPDFTSTTEDFESTTFRTSLEQKSSLEFSAELDPPTPDSGEGEEFLQREQTQSFVKHRNELFGHLDKPGKSTTTKPWTIIEEDDILDPAKINDGLMKSKTTTLNPHAFLPKEENTTSSKARYSGNVQRIKPRYGDYELPETKHHSRLRAETITSTDPWQEIFDSYDLSKEFLPSNSGLQRIANKLFGGLNETEAYHLRNVMAEAEHNRQVLRLLLLLIQTCDDKNGRALERSRKHLLNTLINMDGKIKDELHTGKNAYDKEIIMATTEQYPITTYRKTGTGDEITTTLSYTSTTTDLPTTTTPSANINSSEESTTTPKFVIKVEDNEKEGSSSTFNAVDMNSEANSDKRALELLKSLYSLASKFTRRR